MSRRIIVGMTGGSGSVLGVRVLEALKQMQVETHLVVTRDGLAVLQHETGMGIQELTRLSTHVHAQDNLFAPIASGSFATDGMVVVPCSMKTLAGIAHGYADNLLTRSADVCLKERRPLVLVARETPLSLIHVENMRAVTLAGATVLPPVLSFYSGPKTVDDLVLHVVGKIMDALKMDNFPYPRWS